MFDNVESKLKTVAKVNFVAGIIMAFICLIAALSNELLRTAFIVLTAVMIVFGLIGSWLIYGFAEIVESSKEIRKLASATDFGTVKESEKLKQERERSNATRIGGSTPPRTAGAGACKKSTDRRLLVGSPE